MEENHMGWKLVWGVRQDVVKLLNLFSNTNSVRYEDFCKIWKEMKFGTIFSGRQMHIEKLEFVEEVFQIVKGYLLSVYEFQTRIAALYTLYGLYFKQPLREPVKIRVTKPEWLEIQSLISTCKTEKHYDAVFVFSKLFACHAFLFTYTERVAGLEFGFRKYFKKRKSHLSNNCDLSLLYRPLLSEKLVSSLVQLEGLYCKKKLELLGKRNLDFIDKNFAVSLQNELKKYAAKCQKTNIMNENEEEEKNDTNMPMDTGSSNTKTLKEQSNLLVTDKSNGKRKKKKKLAWKYTLAKKKAELYIKQMKQDLKEESDKTIEKAQCQLPDLDCS